MTLWLCSSCAFTRLTLFVVRILQHFLKLRAEPAGGLRFLLGVDLFLQARNHLRRLPPDRSALAVDELVKRGRLAKFWPLAVNIALGRAEKRLFASGDVLLRCDGRFSSLKGVGMPAA